MMPLYRRLSPSLPDDPVPRNVGTVEADADTATRRLVGHLRYLQQQPRAGESPAERWLFSATGNQVDREVAVAEIIGTGSDPVVWHKLILTPHQAGIADYRAWTRQQMRDLPLPRGHRRCWVGIVHRAPVPHIHVVLAGERVAPLLLDQRRASFAPGALLSLSSQSDKGGH